MKSPVLHLASALSLVVFSWTAAWTASAAQSTNPQLAETIERHFASMSDVREGGLICRSQVEEVQQYLRKTQGNIPASHRLLLNRVLADGAPLTKFFHAEHGEAVLCVAASKLAGYAELEAIARTAAGRNQIRAAIQSDQSDALVEFVKEELAAKSSQQGQQPGQPASKTAGARIYTVEQFIEAALATPSSGKQAPNG